MAAVPLLSTLLFFLSITVHARILKLSSSDDQLISDGLDHHFSNTSPSTSIPTTCDLQYGFLPCAENAAGYIFQMLVYQGLLIYGQKVIDQGSKVLFNITGVGKLGGIVFRILMSLPSMMLMIVSGVFSSKENAQNRVSLGIGIYAGITVFSLTVQWGVCVYVGRRDLKQKKSDDNTEITPSNLHSRSLISKERFATLKDCGVVIDKETRYTAGFILLSMIPYIILQLIGIVKSTSGIRGVTLIALIVSSLCLISYFIYQVYDPWIQQRSLDYSKYDLLRKGFLKLVQRHGKIVGADGKLNTDVIEKLFTKTDKDADKRLGKAEMENLVLNILENGKLNVDKTYAVTEVMKNFDVDDNKTITEEEFIRGCKKWIDENNQESSENGDSTNIFHELVHVFKEKKENHQEIDRVMSKILQHAEKQLLRSQSLVTADGKPSIERIRTLFKQFDSDGDRTISTSELEQLLTTVGFGEVRLKSEDIVKELLKDFDKDGNSIIDEPEFVEGVTKWLNKAISVAHAQDKTRTVDEFDKIVWKEAVNMWSLVTSLFQVLLGIVIVTFLGGPLMTSILELSFAMNLPSFSISFVVVPIALNARGLVQAVLPASHKSERAASLTFSEIYGAVVMNNIAGLTTLLAIVYAKDLTWDFSAEVLTILVVCAIVGIFAYTSNSYPLWTCIVAFLLYPFSFGLYYFVQATLSWN